jgi:pimeloyl-ACP methyl ester carboxylesterase
MQRCLQRPGRVQVTFSFISKDFEHNVERLRDVFFHATTPRSHLERMQALFVRYSTPLRLLDFTSLRVCLPASSAEEHDRRSKREIPSYQSAADMPAPCLLLATCAFILTNGGSCLMASRVVVDVHLMESLCLSGSGLCHQAGACMQTEAPLPLPRPPPERTPPALVLGASQDTVVDQVDCDLLASFYDAKSKMIDGSGHDVMLDEQWRSFAEEIVAFVRRTRKPT